MIYPHLGRWPKVHETAFVAPSADVIGDVEIGELASIWFQVVIRGDVHSVRIGKRTNIQDHSMLHVTRKTSPLRVGEDVTVGHRVLLHGCTIGSRVLVGMGAIIMDDAEIGDDCVIGAGALVTRGKKIPSGSLVMGAPGKVVREITEQERAFLLESSRNYVRDATDYRSVIRSPERYGADKRDLEDFSGEDL
jgi:carbonic anhydrase/acetyltransferase-like protein (isoleucine patch superfamily)